MAAIDLNTVRKDIEESLSEELSDAPPITVVFNNLPFKPLTDKTFVLSEIEFGGGEYITLGGKTSSNNFIPFSFKYTCFNLVSFCPFLK